MALPRDLVYEAFDDAFNALQEASARAGYTVLKARTSDKDTDTGKPRRIDFAYFLRGPLRNSSAYERHQLSVLSARGERRPYISKPMAYGT